MNFERGRGRGQGWGMQTLCWAQPPTQLDLRTLRAQPEPRPRVKWLTDWATGAPSFFFDVGSLWCWMSRFISWLEIENVDILTLTLIFIYYLPSSIWLLSYTMAQQKQNKYLTLPLFSSVQKMNWFLLPLVIIINLLRTFI